MHSLGCSLKLSEPQQNLNTALIVVGFHTNMTLRSLALPTPTKDYTRDVERYQLTQSLTIKTKFDIYLLQLQS